MGLSLYAKTVFFVCFLVLLLILFIFMVFYESNKTLDAENIFSLLSFKCEFSLSYVNSRINWHSCLIIGGGSHTRPAELIDIDVRGNSGRISLSLWDCLRIVWVGGKSLCSFQINALSNVISGMKIGDPELSENIRM